MTNYNERLDEILDDFRQSSIIIHAGSVRGLDEDIRAFAQSKEDAKQALTSHIKELVAEAKPGTWVDPEDTDDLEWQGYVRGVEHFEQNLLKALEEV